MLWDENRLVSGSRDTTVRTWDIRTGKCMYTLSGHTDWVKCLVSEHDLLLRYVVDFPATLFWGYTNMFL
jgi:WD40 repeat protein